MAVGITVVVHIARVRGIATINGSQPPGVAGTLMPPPLYPAFIAVGKNRILDSLHRRIRLRTHNNVAENLILRWNPELAHVIPRPTSRISQRGTTAVS